jgi:hypothetical protein
MGIEEKVLTDTDIRDMMWDDYDIHTFSGKADIVRLHNEMQEISTIIEKNLEKVLRNELLYEIQDIENATGWKFKIKIIYNAAGGDDPPCLSLQIKMQLLNLYKFVVDDASMWKCFSKDFPPDTGTKTTHLDSHEIEHSFKTQIELFLNGLPRERMREIYIEEIRDTFAAITSAEASNEFRRLCANEDILTGYYEAVNYLHDWLEVRLGKPISVIAGHDTLFRPYHGYEDREFFANKSCIEVWKGDEQITWFYLECVKGSKGFEDFDFIEDFIAADHFDELLTGD